MNRESNPISPQRSVSRWGQAAFGLCLWATVLGPAAGTAAGTAADGGLLAQASRALEESIPQVAIQKLQILLAGSDLGPEGRVEAIRKLGEAYLAAGQNEQALEAIAPLVNKQDKAARLMYAEIMGQAGRWSEALPVYSELAVDATAPMNARLGEVEALYALGQRAKATERLEAIVDRQDVPMTAKLRLASLYAEAGKRHKVSALLASLRPSQHGEVIWKRYLEGRLLLLEGRTEQAGALFKEILQEKQLPEKMLVCATLGHCEARVILEGYESADRDIETFIWQNPTSTYLAKMFRRLEAVYEKEEDPPSGELQKWAAQKQPMERAALARFYLARMQVREKKWEKAARSLEVFLQTYPGHRLSSEVRQMEAGLLVLKRDFAGAVRALEAAEREAKDDERRTEIELRTGLVHFQAGDYLLAGNLFDMVARRSPKLREIALYNGALAALNQRHFERFEELYGELGKEFRESVLRGELVLELGLLQARSQDPRAGEALQSFLRQFPQHARTSEARLALAELAFETNDLPRSQQYRLAVNQAAPGTELADQSQLLAVFLADSQNPRRDEEVIALAAAFIRERPQSSLIPEVRMKLGQVYFRKDDFANAETQFATLAHEAPESQYAETALYLAGQSAMKSINNGSVDRALGYFDQVVQKEGPLKLYARQQQAIAQSRLDKETETIALYDIILSAQPAPDAELRYASLAGKGDSFLALGRKEPKYLENAVAVFGQLASESGVPVMWRNQSLYKKAKALELLGRVPECLVAYYDILDSNTAESREFLWYYKAGFDAARIFESQGQWKSAIGVYEKMVKLEGPRSDEARAQMRQLRLEHFIWE